MSSPHFDIICDRLMNRRTTTWNLFYLIKNQKSLWSHLFVYPPIDHKWEIVTESYYKKAMEIQSSQTIIVEQWEILRKKKKLRLVFKSFHKFLVLLDRNARKLFFISLRKHQEKETKNCVLIWLSNWRVPLLATRQQLVFGLCF